MCAAFGISPFPGCISSVYILHISCRLLPTCIGSFHVFFICQMCPLPSCICSFYSSSICNFCIFSTCILLSHFFCNCHVCLFQIRIFQFHCFCIVSPFFQDVNILDPRTSASRQHKIIVYYCVGFFPNAYRRVLVLFWGSEPFATSADVRSEGNMVTFGGLKRRVASFRVEQAWRFVTFPHVSTCPTVSRSVWRARYFCVVFQ